MSAKDKWVRRFSVDETSRHKNGFTIYKITSALFPLESPEAVTVVSVWKRYSDVQRLHKSMRALHAGLHLRGTFPVLARNNFFKRFQNEVIEERAKSIKTLLQFVAEHKLLFTSTDFVNFLQTGYPQPTEDQSARPTNSADSADPATATGSNTGVIAAIRAALHLPMEDMAPHEQATDDDSPQNSARSQPNRDEVDVSRIPIYEAADVETRPAPKTTPKLTKTDSFDSINTLDSADSDLYQELDKITIDKRQSCIKKNVLPDLILFDAPSTSFDDNSDSVSVNSTICDSIGNNSMSVTSSRCKSVASLSNIESKTRTENCYVFEAGYMLNLAAKYEKMEEYLRAFECYKAGIEKMLIGVQSDSDPKRRALIKEKTNTYLSYAEAIYRNHLCDQEQSLLPPPAPHPPSAPLSLLERARGVLAHYRVLRVLHAAVLLVLHDGDRACYAMKVIRKIPKNLTEFDEYLLQNTEETRAPILPTDIPYMVHLHSFIQTNNLIFLILSYAPGDKLFDYIKNYTKSTPTTPAREVNLENVFNEPNIEQQNSINENSDVPIDNNNEDISVKELVLNSQRLISNVDKVLSETRTGKNERTEEGPRERDVKEVTSRVESPRNNVMVRCALPAGALSLWAAQILLAIEALHNAGVVCRDLNPSNILLGDRGQVTLTYMLCYPSPEVTLAKLQAKPGVSMYVAPELYMTTFDDEEKDVLVDRACDFWSYGAILYELLCGVPLSFYHRSVFTSHTILQMPDSTPLEVQSLLSQLLTSLPSERLGARLGAAEVKAHPYFRHTHWDQVLKDWVPG